MPTSVTFNGGTLPGIPEHLHRGEPHLQLREVHFWGLVGAAAILGQRKGRILTIQHVVHNQFATYAALTAELAKLYAAVGESGDLTITNTDNGYTETFRHCVYLGFTTGVDARDGPLKDVAGTLDGGWWCRVWMRWLQLTDA